MKSSNSPITDTMLPWMGTVTNNRDSLAPLINIYNNKSNKKQKNITTKPTPAKKSIQSKHSITKRHHNDVKNARLDEYLRTSSTNNPEPKSDDDPYWGHSYKSKPPHTIRIWYTNPCGVGLDSNDVKSHSSFSFLKHKSKADIVCLAETNVHWKRLTSKNSLYSRLKRLWTSFQYSTSHNKHESLGVGQRGGTCTFCVDQTSYRLANKGVDPSGLGRWSWIEFHGKDQYKTRVYTAYRPGSKPSTKSRLTTVYDQHARYIRTNGMTKQPRELFDDHIIIELEKSINSGINTILAIDTNENVTSGPFTRKIMSIGMFNVFNNSNFLPIPPTHYNGSKPISAIYSTRSLQIIQTGILQKYTCIQGDHKDMFTDISISSFLGESMYKITRPELRRLKLNDPRIVKRFLKYAELHMKHNNIHHLSQQLCEESQYPPTQTMLQKQEQLDDQIGRAISVGLKKCRTLHMGAIPHSTILTELRDLHRFWLMVYNKKVGKKISSTLLRRLSKRVNISNFMSIPLAEIKYKLNETRKKYKTFVPHAPSERQKHLEELASVYALEGLKSKESALKQLLNTETSRNQAIVARKFFPKKTISTRVNKVQYIKENQIHETNKPRDLIQALLTENKNKYSCTNDTPLMKKDTHELLGNFAETPTATKIFNHTTPIPTDLPKWTTIMLSKTLYDPSIPKLPITFSTTEVSHTWKITKENKTAPLSGRYNSVYKAFCMNPHTLQILTNAMNVPFLTGTPYERWKNMLDIMTFKSSNSIMINSLRSIIIAEADWNAAGRIHITRRMMSQAEKCKLLPHEHIGGRRGKKSIEGAIAKRLLMENSNLMRKPMVVISTDAANCYDRVVHKYVAFVCRKWGIQTSVIKALLQPLQQAKHYTRTAYGDSDSHFTGINLQGVGQGNTGAAPFWTCVSTSMIEILKDCGYNATFISAISLDVIKLALIAFVDDSELFLTVPSNDVSELIQLADRTLNTWREALQVTGGAMRAKKCGWTLISYDAKGNLNLKHQEAGEIFIPEEDGSIKKILRYNPNEPRQYLGVLQTADGDDGYQLEKMYSDVATWNNKIAKTKMLPVHNLNAMLTRIYKTLLYPLPALSLTYDECFKLSNKLTTSSIPKCNIASTFPLKFRYLPRKYHGLSLPDLYLEQRLGQLRELLTHSDLDDVLGKQLKLSLENMQVELGLTNLFLNYPYSTYGHLVPHTWITSLWEFLSKYELRIQGWKQSLKCTRDHDISILESFSKKGYSDNDLQQLNNCRIFLQVYSLSDICNAEGDQITRKALAGQKDTHRPSTLVWKQIKRPTPREFLLWTQALHSTFCTSSTSPTLIQPLGQWLLPPRQKWQWFFDPQTNTLFRKVDNLIRSYTRTSNAPGRELRSRATWYKARSTMHSDDFTPSEYSLATISSTDRGQYMAALESHTPNATTIPTPAPTNLYDQMIMDQVPHQLLTHQKQYLQSLTPTKLEPFFHQTVRAVSDGSFKSNKGAAAIIFETQNQSNSLVFTTRVPINANKEDGDPYRTELFGVLFSLHVLQSSERLTRQKGHYIISCDNDEALHKSQYTNPIHTSFKHHDILRSIQHITTTINSTLIYEEVMGHAKDKVKRKLTRAEILNDHCDELANIARISLPELPIQDIQMVGEGLSIFHHNTKMYKNMPAQISDIYFKRKAKPIICEKFNINLHQFAHINWDAISHATSLISPMHNIYISKHTTSFLPIGKNTERRGAWKAPFCPRCQHPIETTSHLIQCPSPAARKITRSSSTKFQTWLESTDTDPSLILPIIEITSSYIHNLPIQQQPGYPTPINSQIHLGWHHFMQGRIHTSFQHHMASYYTSIKSRRTASTWVAILIQKIWTIYHFPQWTNRNKYVHNLDRITTSSRERLNLIASLEQAYKSEDQLNLLAKDRHLLERPLQALKKLPNALIRAWLLEFQTAASARDKIFNAETAKSSAILRSFLTKHNTSTRPPSQIQTPIIRTISIPQQILPIPHFNSPTQEPRLSPTPHISSRKNRSRKRKATSTTKLPHPQKQRTTNNTRHCLRTPHIPPQHTLQNTTTEILYPTNITTTLTRVPVSNIGRYVLDIDYPHEPTPNAQAKPFTWNTNGTKTDLMRGSWRPP